MIIYNLNCDNNHQFEGWFHNAKAFESQLEDELICCPQCDSVNVRRVPSAVAIGGHHAKQKESSPSSSQSSQSTAVMPAGTQAMVMYRQLVKTIVSQSEDVGTAFADEARKIHYNEAPERPIRGEATVEECEALRDEGINVVQLPLIRDEDIH
jgi:hypothetical protein